MIKKKEVMWSLCVSKEQLKARKCSCLNMFTFTVSSQICCVISWCLLWVTVQLTAVSNNWQMREMNAVIILLYCLNWNKFLCVSFWTNQCLYLRTTSFQNLLHCSYNASFMLCYKSNISHSKNKQTKTSFVCRTFSQSDNDSIVRLRLAMPHRVKRQPCRSH